MPVHDWTLVEAGIFHAFHLSWLGHLQDTLNGGLLPQDFYALAEQHAGHFIGDLLTLHVSLPQAEPPSPPRTAGGIALAEAPPRVRRKLTAEEVGRTRRRTLAIRHISGHRLVALLEIVSPFNKDRADSVEQFASKAVSALDCGVHLLLVDLFPPGPHDPLGLSGAVWELLNENEKTFDIPVDEPLTLAAYRAGTRVRHSSSTCAWARSCRTCRSSCRMIATFKHHWASPMTPLFAECRISGATCWKGKLGRNIPVETFLQMPFIRDMNHETNRKPPRVAHHHLRGRPDGRGRQAAGA